MTWRLKNKSKILNKSKKITLRTSKRTRNKRKIKKRNMVLMDMMTWLNKRKTKRIRIKMRRINKAMMIKRIWMRIRRKNKAKERIRIRNNQVHRINFHWISWKIFLKKHSRMHRIWRISLEILMLWARRIRNRKISRKINSNSSRMLIRIKRQKIKNMKHIIHRLWILKSWRIFWLRIWVLLRWRMLVMFLRIWWMRKTWSRRIKIMNRLNSNQWTKNSKRWMKLIKRNRSNNKRKMRNLRRIRRRMRRIRRLISWKNKGLLKKRKRRKKINRSLVRVKMLLRRRWLSRRRIRLTEINISRSNNKIKMKMKLNKKKMKRRRNNSPWHSWKKQLKKEDKEWSILWMKCVVQLTKQLEVMSYGHKSNKKRDT